MEIKMIVSDYDGTLTNKEGKVSQNTIDSVNLFQDNGGIFVVATGRTRDLVIEPLKNQNIKGKYLISYCGSLITHEYDGMVIRIVYIKEHVIKRLIREILDSNLACILFSKDYALAIGNSEYYEKYLSLGALRKYVKVCPNEESIYSSIDTKNIIKCTILNYDGSAIEILSSFIEEIKDLVSISETGSYYTELVDIEATKSKSVSFLSDYLGILDNEVICVGDSNNDYEMIKEHENGYVVGNANEKLKRVAKKVLKHCNDEPFVELISKMLLKR